MYLNLDQKTHSLTISPEWEILDVGVVENNAVQETFKLLRICVLVLSCGSLIKVNFIFYANAI